MTLILILLSFEIIFCTIDINLSELQYLADHLTLEECRKLVALAHFQINVDPNELDQPERSIPKDIPCLALLKYWNSSPGEGKGQTHEALGYRLREMGKHELADWLGRTVFESLGKDLNESLSEGLHEILQENTTDLDELAPTFEVEQEEDEWNALDSMLYVLAVGLLFIILGIFFQFCLNLWKKRKANNIVKELNATSDSEAEEESIERGQFRGTSRERLLN